MCEQLSLCRLLHDPSEPKTEQLLQMQMSLISVFLAVKDFPPARDIFCSVAAHFSQEQHLLCNEDCDEWNTPQVPV